MKAIALILGLLLLVGCATQYPTSVKPLVELKPNCNEWTICDTPGKTLYNVSGNDCIYDLDASQAQALLDLMIKRNVPVMYVGCE